MWRIFNQWKERLVRNQPRSRGFFHKVEATKNCAFAGALPPRISERKKINKCFPSTVDGSTSAGSSRISSSDRFHRKLAFLASRPSRIVVEYMNNEPVRAHLILLLAFELSGYWRWLRTGNVATTEAQNPWLDLFPESPQTIFTVSTLDPDNNHVIYFLDQYSLEPFCLTYSFLSKLLPLLLCTNLFSYFLL